MTIKNTAPWFSEDLKEQYLEISRDILDSGELVCGPYTSMLEEEVAKVCQTKFSVCVSSGTAALEIIFKYLNVEDHEILIPNNTFISTLYAVKNAKAVPILTDIDPHTFCIDIEDVRKKITHRTKVLLLVHIAGYVPSNVGELKRLCDEHQIFLVEDSSHAFGASYGEHKAGGIGLASACSLYPTKIVTGGVGGLVSTNDRKLYEFALLLRSHGNDLNGKNQYISSNWLMSEFSALLCLLQVRDINNILSYRNRIAAAYNEIIAKYEHFFSVQPCDDNRIHPFYKFIVKCKDKRMKTQLLDFFSGKAFNWDIAMKYL